MDCITRVRDVLKIVDQEENLIRNLWVKNKYATFPHGIWFRGQPKKGCDLTPKIFRKDCKDSKRRVQYDESSMFHEYQLRLSSYRAVYKSAFDWLCLMQHYRLPTRLLDWSESILVALYFAVNDSEETKEKDAELFALSAGKLNDVLRPKERGKDPMPTIYTPDNFMVILRTETARSDHYMDGFFPNLLLEYAECAENVKLLDEKIKKEGWRHVAVPNLVYPVAVYPFRLNSRMTFQESVFTIHGGKYYIDRTTGSYALDGVKDRPIPLPEYGTLECINQNRTEEDEKFLKSFTIPREKKKSIKNELERIGIHEGTLFPELEHQASYIDRRWKLNVC